VNRSFAKLSLFALAVLLLAQPLLAGRIDSAAPGFLGTDHREPYRLESGGAAGSLQVVLRAAFNRSASGVQAEHGTAYRDAFRGVDAARTLDGVARETLTISNPDALVAYDLVQAKGLLAAAADGRGVRFLAQDARSEGLTLSAPLVMDAQGRPSIGARWVVEQRDGQTRLRLAVDDANLRYPIQVSYAQGRASAVALAAAATLRAATSRHLLPATNADGTLTGHVQDGSGAPIANAFINVYYSTGDYATTEFTDASGNYAISLPPDTYFVTAFADGYETKLYNNIQCSSGCSITSGNAVNVTSGGTASGINFTLALHRATISGVVTNVAGAPLGGVYVLVYSGSTPVAIAVSDESTGA